MRLVRFNELTGKEILAKPIINSNGNVLLSQGTRLKSSYVEKLQTYGISSVYIEDSISEGIEIEDILCDEVRFEARGIIEKEIHSFSKTRKIRLDEVQSIVKIISERMLLNKSDLLINLKDIKLKDEYLFSHSVNVCTLAVYLLTKMGYDHNKIEHIGMGCLLHDIGKILLSPEILAREGALKPSEFELLKKHPVDGYMAIKDDLEVYPITKVIVLMHHERVDGTGYPSGLTENKIHESAKLCSICDAFDSMSSDRSYKKSFSFSDIIKYLYSFAGKHLDKNLVNEFLKYIPIYPPGTIVLLNNGIFAIVIRNNNDNLLKPLVRYIYNSKSKIRYGTGALVDLSDEIDLKIEKEISLDMNTFEAL